MKQPQAYTATARRRSEPKRYDLRFHVTRHNPLSMDNDKCRCAYASEIRRDNESETKLDQASDLFPLRNESQLHADAFCICGIIRAGSIDVEFVSSWGFFSLYSWENASEFYLSSLRGIDRFIVSY